LSSQQAQKEVRSKGRNFAQQFETDYTPEYKLQTWRRLRNFAKKFETDYTPLAEYQEYQLGDVSGKLPLSLKQTIHH
jgi:hypothetical protein